MMDTDTSVISERIGQLCHQFKLPTMGAQSVARFTAAGHGDALPTFLEVRSGSAASPTPWPPPRPSTGWCTTP